MCRKTDKMLISDVIGPSDFEAPFGATISPFWSSNMFFGQCEYDVTIYASMSTLPSCSLQPLDGINNIAGLIP